MFSQISRRRLRHEALWATLRKDINVNIIRVTDNLYDKAQSAVLLNGSTGVWFRTTVGHGCLPSPIIYNISIARIVCEALDVNGVIYCQHEWTTCYQNNLKGDPLEIHHQKFENSTLGLTESVHER